MDNKIKYVDLNGLKVFAESLKQDLKNHVIELGLYQELLHRIENLELYKIVDSLPEIGDENTIYLLKNPSGSGDKNIFIEYLYNNEHGWEEIGNFTPSFDLEDYLKIEDAPFEKGDAENSAVLKGGNNQVISEGSVALGKDNFVGLKGWYYKAVQIGNNSNVVYLYLTTEQQIPIFVSSASAVENKEKNINFTISKGDICSIINGNRLIDCFEVRLNEMSNYGRISLTYKGEGTNPLSIIQNVEELKLEDYSVFCISKPSCGIVDLSKCNIALGNNTKSLAESSVSIGLRSTAVGITSYAEGQDTIAVGECSHAEGYNTLATGGASHSEGSATKATGLHSHAEGDTTEASGEQSHAEGKQTIAEGEHSHSEGYWTKAHGKSSHVEGQGLNNTTYSVASGDYSHSEGFYTRAFGTGSHTEGTYTIAYNKGEHAEGIYNKSTENVTLHSVGIGTSVNDRKNAHEITNDGKHYIYGVGGYDGTNPDKATDVASELTELSAEVSGLSERIENLPSAESDVFKAVYGTTTIEEVTEAYNQGKVIHCDYNGMCFVLSAFNGGQAFFTSLSANYSTRLELKSDSRWAISYFTMEENKNKVKTISESSTDTQYPSAKAVYEALQNLPQGGGDSPIEKGDVENSAVLKGGNNKVTNANEVALGKYNKSNNDTQFSIGIGTSDTDRGNAFEVKQNGDVYITRVEKPIQTELAELSEEVGKRNVGAEDTDESVEEPESGGGGMTTPSGDPMHYMFEAVGAEWNGTGADIEKQGVYGDSYVHKAKHWNLNELGDITNEEMREIYLFANLDNSAKNCAQLMQGITTRTNIATWSGAWNNKIKDAQLFGFADVINVILRRNDIHYTNTNISYMFTGCTALQKILPTLDATSTTTFNGIFDNCNNLREVRIKNVKVAIKFNASPLISKASILYLIQNSAATSAMVITLHADAYARIAEDADIVAALAEKTNVSLASA